MEKKKPKVGVALLAYNQGEFVDDAIESLRKQTFQDFEVILIDDGSNDGFTREKLQSIEYDKISEKRLYKTNLGSPKRRRQCDELMKNKYIIDFCGDDVLDPTFLEKTVKFLDKHPSYGAVCTNLRLFRDNPSDYYYEKKYDKNTMKFPYMLVSCNMLGSSLMRREALEGLNLNWPMRTRYDWNRWNAMLKNNWKLGLVEEPLFYYRQVETSLSHIGKKEDDKIFREELIKRYGGVFDEYHMDIIRQLFEVLAELQEGKDWLDKQYYSLNEEIERLTKYNEDLMADNEKLKTEIAILSETRRSKIRRKLKRMMEKLK